MKLFNSLMPILVFATLVAGCSVQMAPLRKYEPLPSAPLSVTFISEQGSEKPKEALGLEAAVAICLTNNHALRIAREEINIAEGQLQQAKLLDNPEIEFSINASSAADSVLSLAGSLLQPISLFWPKRQVTILVAEAVVERAKAEVQRVEGDMRVTIKKTYLQTILQQNERALYAQSLDIIQKLSSTTSQLKVGGEVSRLGELLVQSEVVEAKARLIEAESSLAKKKSELVILLGIASLPPLLEGIPEIPNSFDFEPLQLSRSFVAGNTEMYLRDAEIRLALLSHTAAQKIWWPAPKLGVSAERDTDKNRLSGGMFSFELPVFNRNEGEIQSRTAMLQKAQIEREQTQFVGQHSLDRLMIVLRRTMQLIAVYRDEGLPAVEENLVLIQRAIEAGELSALELIAARKQAITMQLAYLQMRFAVVEVLLELEAVLGTPVFELHMAYTTTQENAAP